MKNRTGAPSSSRRIALLWRNDTFQGQRLLTAIYRWAGLTPELTLRQFDVLAPDFRRAVAEQLVQWRPHGLLLRTANVRAVRELRRRLPRIPFVSTIVTPPGLVDTMVVVDIAEAIALARDHFRSRGLQQVALFYGGPRDLAANRIEPFRAAAPDGPVLQWPVPARDCARGPQAAMRRAVGAWLRDLPKPVGVLTLENSAARHLTQIAQQLGLHIPRDLQLIGIDDADECLACEPHLTSLHLPSERVGEAAMETMLRYVRRERPAPPPVVLIPGTTLIARGSTGLATVGADQVAAALKTITAGATAGLSAARVVRQSKVGVVTFYKQFRAATGSTPARHLRAQRLKEACRLLATTAASVAEIAKACGLSSPEYFTHFFRRETGHTPTGYRNRRRE